MDPAILNAALCSAAVKSAIKNSCPPSAERTLNVLRASELEVKIAQANNACDAPAANPIINDAVVAAIQITKLVVKVSLKRVGTDAIAGGLKDPKLLFLGRCAMRHFGQDSRASALPLDDLKKLKSYVGAAGRTVEEMMKGPNYLMPPEGGVFPAEKERELMVNLVHQE